MTTTLKRDRLIEAAKAKFYQQGVARTTLADIAQQAQVPLGMVYYHFRTKEALSQVMVCQKVMLPPPSGARATAPRFPRCHPRARADLRCGACAENQPLAGNRE